MPCRPPCSFGCATLPFTAHWRPPLRELRRSLLAAKLQHSVLPALVAFGLACQPATPPAPANTTSIQPDTAWLLAGDMEQRFTQIAGQLRGLDVAMVETGYRYGELYWAGRDQNWQLAQYQVNKIRVSLAKGVERRPKRAASARMLEPALLGVEDALAAGSARAFAEQFELLTTTCNNCHAAEGVRFIHVQPPAFRACSVLAAPRDGGSR